MADRDVKLPTPPPSPRKSVPEPAKAISLNSRAVSPAGSESYTVGDLSRETRGPLGSKSVVEKELSSEWRRRQQRRLSRDRATEREFSRPVSLRGGKR
jgi:hypothetical protein